MGQTVVDRVLERGVEDARRPPAELSEFETKLDAIVDYVMRFWLEHRVFPTIRETMVDMGISSTSVTDYAFTRLVLEGAFIEDEELGSRKVQPSEEILVSWLLRHRNEWPAWLEKVVERANAASSKEG